MAPFDPDRVVRAEFAATVVAYTEFVLSVAVAEAHAGVVESLSVTVDGAEIPVRELIGPHGTRLHVGAAEAGELRVSYRASVGRAVPAPVDPLDAITYGRPSRYVEADALTAFAREQFSGLSGVELVFAVERWVHERLRYAPTDSAWRGGAEATLASGVGVCRDFAHVVLALLRALDVPARLVAVYAPGLVPMDFHAVVEALVDDRWLLVDATRLAPRRAMVRIATGRDAADTAFLTNTLADIDLTELRVDASVPGLEPDDPTELVELS